MLYDKNNSPTWSSNTSGKGTGPYKAVMQPDGNFVVQDSTGAGQWWSNTSGVAAVIMPANATAAQNTIAAAKTTGRIKSRLGYNKCIDVGRQTDLGSRARLWDCNPKNDNPNQYINRSGNSFILGDSGRCLDVAGGKSDNGTKIQAWSCDPSNDNQMFSIDNGQIKWHGKCVDVTGGNSSNDTNINLYDCNGTDSQKFDIVD